MFKRNSAPRHTKRKTKERFTVRVHPLFLLCGVFFLFRGEFFLFLTVTVVAVIHEFGHAFYAARIGFRLDRLVLLPCGALVSGDIEGMSFSQEVRLALAGPVVNAACALAFVALWWIFPETYPYTDTAAYTSATLALVNLIPAWPLDGGRVFYCALVTKIGARRAEKIVRGAGILFTLLFFALFVYSFFVRVNFSLFFFGAFILAGTFGSRGRYYRLRFDRRADLRRGLEVKKTAVSDECTVGSLMRFLERGKYLEFSVYTDGVFRCELSEEEFTEIFQRADLNAPLSAYLEDISFSVLGSDENGVFPEK